MSRPASMRLAMAISPSRDSSSTEPISQIHAHRVVGAADILVVEIAGALLAVAFLLRGGRGGLLALLAFDDVDAGLGEHRHGVLDLLGGHLIGRQGGVQLVIGDITALLAARDHLLDGGGSGIDQRPFCRFLAGFSRLGRSRRFRCHPVSTLHAIDNRRRGIACRIAITINKSSRRAD